MELSPATKSYIEKKMDKVNRQLRDVLDFNIVVSDEKTKSAKDRYSVQLTLNNHGTILRVEERGDNVTTATDRVEEILMRRIERYKGRFMERVRGNFYRRFNLPDSVDEMMNAADGQMYHAKKNGKNRIQYKIITEMIAL